MKYYRTEGLIEEYIVPPVNAPVYTMVFMIEGQFSLELCITDAAIASADCGVTREKVNEWLWETGDYFFLSEEVVPSKITITATDVRSGHVVTPFNNLRSESL
ncbi:hypothetical protein [Ornithinibacillus scapharcae]|uniref:hypothetical protein n=1 Tax=Ornithinibacillus scapharcae TaxID=1147159 RepID=UPI000225AE73|nr:hypothetical protein [Ornithinibacillus scapharcae]